MEADVEPRGPVWAIDHLLTRLQGRSVRVAAQSFVPRRADGTAFPRLIPVAQLILPDGSTPGACPVFFEGLLEGHVRRIGVVDVILAELNATGDSADGISSFRGTTAVILSGPAIVRLAYPFAIEPIYADPVNYWLDFKGPHAQFELALGDQG